MTYIDYFKSQAKKLFKDYKTREPYMDSVEGQLYRYSPKYFDIEGVILAYDIDEEHFSLMKAQHIIALMVGFEKWDDLKNASEKELELAQLLFENQHKVNLDEWEMFIARTGYKNKTYFEADEQIEILKKVFVENEAASSLSSSFLLKHERLG